MPTIWTTASWLNQVLFLSFFLPLMKESKFNTILLSLTTPTASWLKNQNSAQFICSSRNNQAKDSKVTSLMELLFLWYVFWYNIAFSALSSIASIGRNILFIYCLLKVHRAWLLRRIVKVVIVILMYWFIQPIYLAEKPKILEYHLEALFHFIKFFLHIILFFLLYAWII